MTAPAARPAGTVVIHEIPPDVPRDEFVARWMAMAERLTRHPLFRETLQVVPNDELDVELRNLGLPQRKVVLALMKYSTTAKINAWRTDPEILRILDESEAEFGLWRTFRSFDAEITVYRDSGVDSTAHNLKRTLAVLCPLGDEDAEAVVATALAQGVAAQSLGFQDLEGPRALLAGNSTWVSTTDWASGPGNDKLMRGAVLAVGEAVAWDSYRKMLANADTFNFAARAVREFNFDPVTSFAASVDAVQWI
ncbi:unnamed protein product [Mycena citricolor]|uniref:Uncharacterized protein n=1 Tax=Mycena citricolor TaxID=2018698 RepID=A0AAD2Q6R7_9AGAR|nr:unnamed protein product [Mycena citricolor]CAK5282593.1 unnamed protein product [Mycena citricolor]CAK5282606.1 unnamed protein product [Mycena citricolor]